MAYQGISTGAAANDGTGDSLAVGAVKINSNFQELYSAIGDGSTLSFTEKVQDAVGSAINAGIKIGISVTYDDANNRIDFANYNITTTSVNKTLSNLEYCTVDANNLSLTLPSSVSVGNKVMVGISTNYNNTTIVRNGNNIMGFAEDMVIDTGYVTLTMIYINSTLGWRIS